jgi:hypothetical protein
MCTREPGRCGATRLGPNWSCVRDEGVGLDGRSPAGSKIEGKGELGQSMDNGLTACDCSWAQQRFVPRKEDNRMG